MTPNASEERAWTLYERDLPGGRSLYVYPLTFGRARLGIGATGSCVFDDVW